MSPNDKLGALGLGVLLGLAFLFAISGPNTPAPTVVVQTEVERQQELSWAEKAAKVEAMDEFYRSKVTVVMPRTYIKDANVSIAIIKLPTGACYMITRGSDNVVVTPVDTNIPLLIGTPP